MSATCGPTPVFAILTCSMWLRLEAPMMTASPYSRFIKLWCDTQRSAISARVKLCFCATTSIDASALKYASFQYRLL